MGLLWTNLLYRPLLNALAFLVSVVPGADIGVAVIILTLLVKTALFPLSQRSIESQAKMNLLTPELNKIKKSGASKEEQAKQTFELYKKYKTNPFAGCLLILIQLPIIFALYYVFYKGLKFDASSLYSFIHAPASINMHFLGLLDLSKKSAFLALLAGISQYLQAHYMSKPAKSSGDGQSMQENFARSMQMQMKYVFPFVVAFIAYNISGAVALYWITSNIFIVGQQIYVQKKQTALVIK